MIQLYTPEKENLEWKGCGFEDVRLELTPSSTVLKNDMPSIDCSQISIKTPEVLQTHILNIPKSRTPFSSVNTDDNDASSSLVNFICGPLDFLSKKKQPQTSKLKEKLREIRRSKLIEQAEHEMAMKEKFREIDKLRIDLQNNQNELEKVKNLVQDTISRYEEKLESKQTQIQQQDREISEMKKRLDQYLALSVVGTKSIIAPEKVFESVVKETDISKNIIDKLEIPCPDEDNNSLTGSYLSWVTKAWKRWWKASFILVTCGSISLVILGAIGKHLKTK